MLPCIWPLGVRVPTRPTPYPHLLLLQWLSQVHCHLLVWKLYCRT